MNLIPTILCGGAGSRLWPVSRELHPKPFIQLADGQSLLQKAFLRGAQLPNVAEILTVTNRELFLKSKEEYIAVNSQHLKTSFLLEPCARNTAAAITAAALLIAKSYGEEALLLVLAADHLIEDQDIFQTAVADAINLAKQGKLVTFGIHARTAETGYGYIEAEGNTVIRFVEKPSLEKAEEYVASGRYLWNSGIFCFQAGTLLQQMEQHAAEIFTATTVCMSKSKPTKGRTSTQVELEPASFKNIPENSIDYALMEQSKQVAVVPCNFSWSDIGSWNTLANLIKPDANNNQIEGDVLLHDVQNCYIKSNYRITGAVGVENLVIIDTQDALLVANKSCVQDVKQIYTQLKIQDHETHKLHRTVFRPWGTYTVLEEGECFKIKRIVVNPGASLSLQMHRHRSEHWVVVSGTAKVTNGDQIIYIKTNESTYIPAGNKHRLENTSDKPVVMIEVQSGDYVGEDDIIRFEDVYGRAIEEI